MIIVTKEDFKSYIFSQPDVREVNMLSNFENENCGCIMIHYGSEVCDIKNLSCGYNNFFTINSEIVAQFEEIDIQYYIKECIYKKVRNYRQAKKEWIKHFGK